jgi:hypothetical protein
MIKKAGLFCAALILALAAAEVALRITGIAGRDGSGAPGTIRFDAELGWSLEPGSKGVDEHGNRFTVLADGTRSTGSSEKMDARPLVVAVGDSFTFGAEAADENAWPAKLEQMIGLRVVNGGVPGYGVGQINLRAKQLLRVYEPDLLIVGIYHDDVYRTALSFRGRAKPYFELHDGRIILRNSPLRERFPARYSPIGRFIGGSRLARISGFARRTGLDDAHVVVAHDDYEQVSALLLLDIAEAAEASETPVLFVFLFNDLSRATHAMMARVCFYLRRENRGVILDLHPVLSEIRNLSAAGFGSLFTQTPRGDDIVLGHLTEEGNDLVARSAARVVVPLLRRGARANNLSTR